MEEKNLQIFIDFYKALGYNIDNTDQFFDGVLIGSFLTSLPNSQIRYEDLICDRSVQGGSLANFKIILRELERLEQQSSSSSRQNGLSHVQQKQRAELYEICTLRKKEHLLEILKRCFVLSAKAENSREFISTVLTLDEKSQFFFAELLSTDPEISDNLPKTPNRDNSIEKQETNPVSLGSSKRRVSVYSNNFYNKSQQIELIDKYYDLEEENQKLSFESKRLIAENYQLQEKTTSLNLEVKLLKTENESLKMNIQLCEKEFDKKNYEEHCVEEYEKNIKKESIKYYEKIVKELKEKIEIMEYEREVMRKKHERRTKELEEIVRTEKEGCVRYEEELEELRNQLELLMGKCKDYEREVKINNENFEKLKKKSLAYEENEAVLKFQLNYKNSQIQEMKEIIMNSSNNGRDDESEDSNIHRSSSCRILKNEFFSIPAPPTPRSMLQLDMQELKNLRVEVKQLQKEIESLKNLKIKNKELQYEKKKLMKILKEYNMSRGEQNQILAGCLYELHLKMSRSIHSSSSEGGKQFIIQSKSTVDDQ